MDILQHAIDAAGGVGKLAKVLGIRQNVVSNWKARERLPLAWCQLLELKYGKPKTNKRKRVVLMGRKSHYARHLRRYAQLPHSPCVYVAELRQADRLLLKVGMGGNALGRMVSLHSESKRILGAAIGRFAIFTAPTYKAAFEAETRAVKALGLIATPVAGRREFFAGLSFERVCEVASEAMGGFPCAFIGEEVSESTKGGDVGVFHPANVLFFASAQNPNHP